MTVLDNIAQVTDALKHITRYTYDKNGNLLTETDALGNRVRYAHTPEGWLESITAGQTSSHLVMTKPAACSPATWATVRRWKAVNGGVSVKVEGTMVTSTNG